MDEDVITKVEEFIKNDLNSSLTKLGVPLEPYMNNMFYGKMYASSPAEFQFLLGERKKIEAMAKYVKHVLSSDKQPNTGVYCFYEKISASKFMKGTTIVRNLGRMFSDDFPGIDHAVCGKNLESKLYEELVVLYQQFNLSDVLMKKFGSEMIKIITINGVITGIVKCVLCEDQATNVKSNKKEKEFRIYTRLSGNTSTFILSNFKKHILNFHIKRTQNNAVGVSDHKVDRSKPDKTNIRSNENVKESVGETIVEKDLKTKDLGEKCCAQNSLLKDSQLLLNQKSEVDSETKCDVQNSPLYDLQLDLDQNFEVISSKICHAQASALNDLQLDSTQCQVDSSDKCGEQGNSILDLTEENKSSDMLNRMVSQISNQNIQLSEACDANNEIVTSMKFEIDGEMHNVLITQIEKDGNCLYGAIVHQL